MQVRKVYKKLALKLHPDKALAQCKFSTSVVPSAQGPATVAKVGLSMRIVRRESTVATAHNCVLALAA